MQQDDATDTTLLRRTKAYLASGSANVLRPDGLAEAWVRFYGVYSRLIERFALRCGVRPEDLDDCVQEVWTEVLTALRSFQYDRRRGRFRAWVYTLVRCKATDLLRRKVRNAAKSRTWAIERARLLDNPPPDPAEVYDRHWQRETVQTVLAELQLQRRVSAQSFQVLHMRRIQERSVSEVARTLGLTAEQVRARQHRMQRKFRALYREYTGQGPSGSLTAQA